MNKEIDTHHALIDYTNKFIDRKARVTSKLAARTSNPTDPIIEEAIYYDILANEPTPEESHDNDELKS